MVLDFFFKDGSVIWIVLTQNSVSCDVFHSKKTVQQEVLLQCMSFGFCVLLGKCGTNRCNGLSLVL